MTLGIAVEKVCEIVAHLRTFDSGVDVEDPDATEDQADDVIEEGELEERLAAPHGDPVYDELIDVIDSLNVEEQVNLVALLWTGRGDYAAADWEDALAAARDRHSEHTGEYVLGIPIAGDHIEAGLNELGFSCED